MDPCAKQCSSLVLKSLEPILRQLRTKKFGVVATCFFSVIFSTFGGLVGYRNTQRSRLDALSRDPDVLNHDQGWTRWVARITTNLEPCITMLLEKLQKSDWSLADCCVYLQHTFKNQPRLLWESGEISSAARNSHVLRSIMSLVN